LGTHIFLVDREDLPHGNRTSEVLYEVEQGGGRLIKVSGIKEFQEGLGGRRADVEGLSIVFAV
jgi:hypothetical protein